MKQPTGLSFSILCKCKFCKQLFIASRSATSHNRLFCIQCWVTSRPVGIPKIDRHPEGRL